MRKLFCILVLISINSLTVCFAQNKRTVDSLCRLCNRARSDTDKVVALNNLAKYYYGNKFIREGDSVLQLQLKIAELSDNNNLILKTYFDNSIASISKWSSTDDFDRTAQFIQ